MISEIMIKDRLFYQRVVSSVNPVVERVTRLTSPLFERIGLNGMGMWFRSHPKMVTCGFICVALAAIYKYFANQSIGHSGLAGKKSASEGTAGQSISTSNSTSFQDEQATPLANNVFSSIRAFQDYLLIHQSLTIPPGGSLTIRDPWFFLKHNFEIEDNNQVEFLNMNHRFLRQIDKFMVPIGFTLSLNFPPQEPLYRFGDAIEATFPMGAKILAKKAEKFVIRISEFFTLMVASGRRDFEIKNNQQLFFIGLNSEFSNEVNLLEEVAKRLPLVIPGFDSTIKGQDITYLVGADVSLPGTSQPQNAFVMQGDDFSSASTFFIQFSVFEMTNTFSYPDELFIKRMLLQSPFVVPKNQKLIVKGKLIREMGIVWDREFKGFPAATFILSQLFLPFGRTIQEIKSLGFSLQGDLLEIFSESDFTLELAEGNLITNLSNLAERMIMNKRTSIDIHPNQKLICYGIDQTEKETIISWMGSPEGPNEVVKQFFLKRSPIGFHWHLEGSKMEAHITTDPGYNWLILSSREKINISITRSIDGAHFAYTILQNSHPALRQGLLDSDVSAFIYLLFRSISYFCCDNFRFFENEILPPYFKEETQRAIANTLQDELFTSHLRKICEHEHLLDRLRYINQVSPEEFDLIEETEESLVFVINRIKNIAGLELQNSTYLTESIKYITDYIKINDL